MGIGTNVGLFTTGGNQQIVKNLKRQKSFSWQRESEWLTTKGNVWKLRRRNRYKDPNRKKIKMERQIDLLKGTIAGELSFSRNAVATCTLHQWNGQML